MKGHLGRGACTGPVCKTLPHNVGKDQLTSRLKCPASGRRGDTFGNEQSHVTLGLTRACVGRQLSST